MDFKNIKNINLDHTKYLENKLLNKQFEGLEKIYGEQAIHSPLFNTKDFANQFGDQLKNLWIKKIK